MSIDEALQQGIEFHKTGQLQKAERMYRAILQVQPNHPDANHNLGILAVQVFKPGVGLPYFKIALENNPQKVQFWVSYIEVLINTGDIDSAKKTLAQGRLGGLGSEVIEQLESKICAFAIKDERNAIISSSKYRSEKNNKIDLKRSKSSWGMRKESSLNSNNSKKSSKKNPSQGEVGAIVKCFNSGNYEDAEKLTRQLVVKFPDDLFGLNILGAILNQCNRSKEATVILEKARSLHKNDPGIYNNMGLAFANIGRLDEALGHYTKSLKLKPNFFEAHYNMGNALKKLGRFDEAIERYVKALKIKPDLAEALNNMGLVYLELGRIDKAIEQFTTALEINASFADAHNNLGNALKELGRLDEAVVQYRKFLEIKPDYAEVHNNFGNALQGLGRLDEALEQYTRSIELMPSLAEPHSNMANVLQNLGRFDEAIEQYMRAMELKPDYACAYSNMLFCFSHTSKLSFEVVAQKHSQFGTIHESELKKDWKMHKNDRNTKRILRVGFISGDFKNHPVAYFIEPVFKSMDRSSVAIYAYANHLNDDHVSDRLKGLVDSWCKISGMTDQCVAKLIQNDKIDILVDLSGHTDRNRLLVFARKPAPVQCSWGGSPNSTGLSAVDYFVTDYSHAPVGTELYFTERLLRLPTNFVFQPNEILPAVNELPALKNGIITFGSFNRFPKINRDLISLWSAVLQAVPDSRFVIGNDDGSSFAETITSEFTKHGINAGRVVLHKRVPLQEYLKLHSEVDIILDSFPYGGGTTSCHALWMGVPVVGIYSPSSILQVSRSILNAFGMLDFFAEDKKQYIEIAKRWADDIPRLALLRRSLRQHIQSYPLADPEVFAKYFERGLRKIWKRWCENIPPKNVDVCLDKLDEVKLLQRKT